MKKPQLKSSRRVMCTGAIAASGLAVSSLSLMPKSSVLAAQTPTEGSNPSMFAPNSRLKRIKMATLGAPDLTKVETWYGDWLKYQTFERGTVSSELAASWRAPACAGRPYTMLGPDSGEDVYIRAVEIDPVPGFKTLQSWGWAAVEITVKDVDQVMKDLEGGPFKVLGAPRALTATSPIRAMQVLGPADEVIYLTGNTGDRLASNHPDPKSAIDRIFIMVLAGPDLGALKSFYLDKFGLGDQGDLSFPVQVLAEVQGIDPDHLYKLSVLVTSERGNKLELDEYMPQFGARPGPKDQLPPGVAMTTFEADSFAGLDLEFIAPPAPLYEGYMAATFIGPAGERTELVVKS